MNPFWLIPFPPAVGAFVLIVAGRKLSRKAVAWLACLAAAASFVLAVISFQSLLGGASAGRPILRTLFTWIQAGEFRADLAFRFDPLSAVMVLVVTGVGLLIHVYSTGYMSRDRSFARFFAFLNLFTFAMLILVLADNLVLMFVGWEGVGLCSYLLIGFWFEKPAAAAAGQKAFIVNRIGDAGFLLGILFLFLTIGGVSFGAINEAVAGGIIAPATATLIAVLLFVGAAGKSAQIPLYVWLPDAMEGPTPVSALIHAATMVTAGVYMVARLNPLYAASPAASEVVAVVGALTAVFAATIALVQNDIKRVLAYSTISQLGYMFIGCGVGAYAAGVFHLYTHAFFKSLLFLAAGSVMHALSGELDMRKMGGLRKHLPRTYPTFLIGAVAIAGVPFLSGFFSKDAVLTAAFAQGRYFIWALGLGGAVLTAFYMFRLVFLTFHGQERLEPEVKRHLHESPGAMTVPLVILAFFSVFAGYVGLPPVVGKHAHLFDRFLEPVIKPAEGGHLGLGTEWVLIAASVAAALLGIGAAYAFFLRDPRIPRRLGEKFPGLYRLLLNKYYVDEAYDAAIVKPLVQGSARVYDKFDLAVIDGAVNGSARAAGLLGRLLSLIQSGLIKDYALAVLFGMAIFLGVLFF
ncbi:MAG: NADH-quinone oxidoreductase subunit L [Candidatus Aminicenantes bacterium]|nr:NADH-quinone oxidoreductase subunit L [Candidatus Aminicenantes bacterium]